MSSRRRLAVYILALALLGTGCERPAPDNTLRPQWHPMSLPVPSGAPGRLMVRDVAACAGRWYVVGAVATADGATRPAAWTSPDAQTWAPVPLTPKTYYGRQNILYAAACRDGRVAVIGAKTGGAHAYPRTSTWTQRPDGSLVEVIAAFTLYGGSSAVNVARIAGGPRGWMIAGNRTSGAAVWVSADSTDFRILEDAPELASDDRGESWAFDVSASPGGWLVVGGLVGRGRIDRDPLAWTSVDGVTWRRITVPGTDEYEELQRVALVGDTPVAVGLRGRVFGAWRGAGDRWEVVGRFGAPGTSGVPAVRALTAADGRLVAATSDGAAHALWVSADEGRSWRAVAAPVAMPAGAERAVAALAAGPRMVLLVDDGQSGRAWWTETAVDAG